MAIPPNENQTKQPKSQSSVPDNKKVKAPEFKLSFLLPNYWPIWIGAAFLYALTWLPYSLIKPLGKGVAFLLAKFAKKRVTVARKNIRLTFPEWSEEQVETIFQHNLQRTGLALFETAMGWWWPAWRIKKHCKVEGFEQVQEVLNSGKGVFGLAIHNVNLEMACRAVGYAHQSIAFYRPHNNPLMDYLQYRGRNRSNKYMIHKRNSKALIQAMNEGELCLYLPDQDYGAKQSVFVPFGGVEQTATTTGTLMFASRTDAVPFLITPQYTKNGYVVKFVSAIDYLVDNDPKEALTLLNQDILKLIKEQPESYLWMHKRFKSRPKESPESLY